MDELSCHSLIWNAGTLQLNRARLQLLYVDPIVLSTKHYFMLLSGTFRPEQMIYPARLKLTYLVHYVPLLNGLKMP